MQQFLDRLLSKRHLGWLFMVCSPVLLLGMVMSPQTPHAFSAHPIFMSGMVGVGLCGALAGIVFLRETNNKNQEGE